MDTRTTDVEQRLRELNIDPTTVLAVHPHTSAKLRVKSNISRSPLDITPLNFNTPITPTTATTTTNAQANASANFNGNNNGNASANANSNSNANVNANTNTHGSGNGPPPLTSSYRTRRREHHARLAAFCHPGALGLKPSDLDRAYGIKMRSGETKEHARARRKAELEEMLRQRRVLAACGDSVAKAQVNHLEVMIDAMQALQ